MQNHLINQTSPYLLQHVDNPVDWYPWCEEAFAQAKAEDKPIFLSIGYSTCHWCHVMAHESFMDEETADILNRNFISIKVDREERPDIDSIYMSVCQTLTGSGGWPTSIFMTPEQKPFFAGTYFPKHSRFGTPGFVELLTAISEKWKTDRKMLLEHAEEVVTFIRNLSKVSDQNRVSNEKKKATGPAVKLLESAISIYLHIFDEEHGGFGDAPKFPSPHNLLFLMEYYRKTEDKKIMDMVDKTLLQMYRGGLFDHIGGGFSRYSTDAYFLVPHFEKMLYDNALLMMAYCKAYGISGNVLYLGVAEKTASYVIQEMTSPRGGFYSAQDADSEGVEGKYYLFEQKEIYKLLGHKDGEAFCRYFDITEKGNFEGKNIPNLLKNTHITANYNAFIPTIYEYRKKRYDLHLDDKILTSWNGLMIGAMCWLYRLTGNESYLGAAERAQSFVANKLCEGDTLFVSWRDGVCNGKGFLDDYANEIFALLCLYEATLDKAYLEQAEKFIKKVINEFSDEENGGFFLSGKNNEKLILQPKETYDGAMPSGNSMMAYNLVRLSHLKEGIAGGDIVCHNKNVAESGLSYYKEWMEQQIAFLMEEADRYPAGYAMFLTALLDFMEQPDKITIVVKEQRDLKDLPCRIPLNMLVHVLDMPTEEYPLLNDKTTYYVCKGKMCLPPSNVFSVS